jgi:uncharacterized protein YcfJ
MSKLFTSAALGFVGAGLLAGSLPAAAATAFDRSPSVSQDVSAGHSRDRDWRERRYYGNRNYNNRYEGRTWRGRDGRYYCRRNDGTTGLLIGGAAGGLIGHGIAGRGDRTLGTILGVAGGALLGREIDRSGSSCR